LHLFDKSFSWGSGAPAGRADLSGQRAGIWQTRERSIKFVGKIARRAVPALAKAGKKAYNQLSGTGRFG